EDIKVESKPLQELFEGLRRGQLDDAKLLVATYWLRDYLKSLDELTAVAPTVKEGQKAEGREHLTLGSVKYALSSDPRRIVGYKTGDIRHIKGVDLWVNSENQDMLMDRFLGKTVSANIRHLGSIKDKDGNVIEDTIEQALRSAIGQRP